ncbi:MAG: hypothetical protein M0R17_04875 [Candidatus Omnitrophica bacterium]|jgi:hypothetical protein|nr:hypothetical protein [Candidatus Omnitrophota bacterium]
MEEKVYTQKDLVSFGLYLLSEEREDLINCHPEFISSDEYIRFRKVHDADLANWENSDASLK